MDKDSAPTPTKRQEAPTWDHANRRLYVAGRLVKELTVTAQAQMAVLDAFEQAGWPESIPDPLNEASDRYHKVLRNTVVSLNTGQSHRLIRFRARDSGQRVRWSLIKETLET